jgi:hypothetical protein
MTHRTQTTMNRLRLPQHRETTHQRPTPNRGRQRLMERTRTLPPPVQQLTRRKTLTRSEDEDLNLDLNLKQATKPAQPPRPTATIEARLYHQAAKPWTKRACNQAVDYVEYALLDAYADDGYAVDVHVHHVPIPDDVSSWDEFDAWQQSGWPAKDANLALADYGSGFGAASGVDGWVEPRFFQDWHRPLDASFNRVGYTGTGEGWPFGIAILLHEIGHTLGRSHTEDGGQERSELFGQTWLHPMAAGYKNTGDQKYVFKYAPSVRAQAPRVE